jgi:hypothetical protein
MDKVYNGIEKLPNLAVAHRYLQNASLPHYDDKSACFLKSLLLHLTIQQGET